MRSHVLTTARLLRDQCHQHGHRTKAAMVTLTYRPDVEWSRRHVTEFIKRTREWLARRGHPLRYVWVHELTKAARPHYHVLIFLPWGLSLPKPDKQGWWTHGSTRIEWVRKAVGYLAKYVSKGVSAGDLPKGARVCGSGGLERARRLVRAWWRLPARIRDRTEPKDNVVPRPGGGRVARLTGEVFPSIWRYVGRVRVGTGWAIKLERIDAHPLPH